MMNSAIKPTSAIMIVKTESKVFSDFAISCLDRIRSLLVRKLLMPFKT